MSSACRFGFGSKNTGSENVGTLQQNPLRDQKSKSFLTLLLSLLLQLGLGPSDLWETRIYYEIADMLLVVYRKQAEKRLRNKLIWFKKLTNWRRFLEGLRAACDGNMTDPGNDSSTSPPCTKTNTYFQNVIYSYSFFVIVHLLIRAAFFIIIFFRISPTRRSGRRKARLLKKKIPPSFAAL